jgi:cytoskeletal protein CcmA (bactofilin family)
MFSKKDSQPNQDARNTTVSYQPTVASTHKPTEIPRAPRDDHPGAAHVAKPQERRMTVGPGIGLDGKITNCDILVVEGTVEATLECKNLEIAKGGKFNGEASVETAEITGDYDGTLTVSDLMRIHSTGRLSGKARYGKVEVEVGGELSGDIASAAHEASAERPKPTAVADAPTQTVAAKETS